MPEICGACSQLFLPQGLSLEDAVILEIREKERGLREGSAPAQIDEKDSVLDAKPIVSARKVQVGSEATLGESKNSSEFQDSSATGFF